MPAEAVHRERPHELDPWPRRIASARSHVCFELHAPRAHTASERQHDTHPYPSIASQPLHPPQRQTHTEAKRHIATRAQHTRTSTKPNHNNISRRQKCASQNGQHKPAATSHTCMHALPSHTVAPHTVADRQPHTETPNAPPRLSKAHPLKTPHTEAILAPPLNPPPLNPSPPRDPKAAQRERSTPPDPSHCEAAEPRSTRKNILSALAGYRPRRPRPYRNRGSGSSPLQPLLPPAHACETTGAALLPHYTPPIPQSPLRPRRATPSTSLCRLRKEGGGARP